MDPWTASVAVLWLVVLFMAFLLAGALRQLGLLEMRLGEDGGALITQAGLERGRQAPDFGFSTEGLQSKRLSELPKIHRVLLFLNPTCVSCHQIARDLREVVGTRGPEFDFLVICRGDATSCNSLAVTAKLTSPLIVDPSGSIQEAYQVKYTPFAYVLDRDQRILVRGVVNNWRQLDGLLDQEGVLEPLPAAAEPELGARQPREREMVKLE